MSCKLAIGLFPQSLILKRRREEPSRETGQGDGLGGRLGGITAGEGEREGGGGKLDANENKVFGDSHPGGREDIVIGGGRGDCRLPISNCRLRSCGGGREGVRQGKSEEEGEGEGERG